MKRVGRTALAVLAGLVVAMVTIVAIEYLSSVIYPPPPGLDPRDRADMARIVAARPAGGMALVLLAWGLATFLGAFIAGRIAREKLVFVIITLAILGGAASNMIALPHPAWFWLAGPLVIVLGGYASFRMWRTQPGAASPDTGTTT